MHEFTVGRRYTHAEIKVGGIQRSMNIKENITNLKQSNLVYRWKKKATIGEQNPAS